MKRLIIILYLATILTATDSSIIEHPTDQWVREGDNALLTCFFNTSAEDCTWQLDYVPVQVKQYKDYKLSKDRDKGNCSLFIKHVNILRDEGVWRCFIGRTPEYPKGILSNTAYLGVIVQPTQLNLIYDGITLPNNSIFKITNEDRITISCETRFGNPASNLFWKLEENVTVDGHSTNTSETEIPWLKKTTNKLNLFIKPNMDLQNIACILNHSNIVESVYFQLNVSYATTSVKIISDIFMTVTQGKEVHFICKANGNPLPYFEWRFKPFSSKDWSAIEHVPEFTLLATKSIEGHYLCIAGNYLGSAKWSSEITVTVIDKVSRLLYDVIIPLIVSTIFILLTSSAVVFYLKYRQKKKKNHLSKIISSLKTNDQFENKRKPISLELNAPEFSGYLVPSPRPLSTATSEDQYVGYDPIRNDESTEPKPSLNRKSSNKYEDINFYESPHIYENAAFNSHQTVTPEETN